MGAFVRQETIMLGAMPQSGGPDPSSDIVRGLCEGTRYRPVRFLGRGGMGQVWIVRQDALRREFALKILHPRFGTRPFVVDRLRLEAQATARIDHPGIVQVIDFWVNDEGYACFVMELLTGNNLAVEMSQRGSLPALEVIEIGVQALSALRAAHAIGVIHRDIKPENLFLHHVIGQGRTVKVLDFGLARVITDFAEQTPDPPMKPTRTGTRVGTPRYYSPEAACGDVTDGRSDLFSLGVTLYEALTGRGPFDGVPLGAALAPSALAQGVTAELDWALLHALERAPSARFQDAAAFEQALRALLPRWHRLAATGAG